MPALLNSYNVPSWRIQRNNNLYCFLVSVLLFAYGGYQYLKDGSINNATEQPDQILLTGRDTFPSDTIAPFREPLVLCYHQVRDWKNTDSRSARTYIVPLAAFRQQMKILYDNGYRPILPDQWSDHPNALLPQKSFILTFDDGTESQYANALPELERYGYKATFFIMTVTLGKANFMTRDQVRSLSAKGHLVGCHTWDHQDVKGYGETDWITQLQRPTQLLEQITGKPVRYFAYPFGSWNTVAIGQIKRQGYLAAYQLAGHTDKNNPSFTIRRMIVDGHWPATRFLTEINSFSKRNRLQP
jgi:peptidoglycan/xylan/chitin deacetylase (PgdA/CDA1 family)